MQSRHHAIVPSIMETPSQPYGPCFPRIPSSRHCIGHHRSRFQNFPLPWRSWSFNICVLDFHVLFCFAHFPLIFNDHHQFVIREGEEEEEEETSQDPKRHPRCLYITQYTVLYSIHYVTRFTEKIIAGPTGEPTDSAWGRLEFILTGIEIISVDSLKSRLEAQAAPRYNLEKLEAERLKMEGNTSLSQVLTG